MLAIYTGRLSEEKNLSVLLEQFAIAVDISSNLHLLLIGHGAYLESLKQQAASLKIAEHVHFYGASKYEEMADLLSAADFYVTASVSEVHPLAVIEGMAVGLPIAASRSPGIVDTVEHGVAGFLASDPDKGLAASMLPLATNRELREQMGSAARKASKSYDIRHTVAETLALYETLRVERPDLNREQKHGRWYRPTNRLRPRLRNIVDRIRLEDEDNPVIGRGNGE